MIILELCLDAHLSYDEYMKQPSWLIDTHYIRFMASKKTSGNKK